MPPLREQTPYRRCRRRYQSQPGHDVGRLVRQFDARHEDGATRPESAFREDAASADTAKPAATSGRKSKTRPLRNPSTRRPPPASPTQRRPTLSPTRPAETSAKTGGRRSGRQESSKTNSRSTESWQRSGSKRQSRTAGSNRQGGGRLLLMPRRTRTRRGRRRHQDKAPRENRPRRRPGQIAVFISRKDSKLYVRQNFRRCSKCPSRSRQATGARHPRLHRRRRQEGLRCRCTGRW